MIDADKMRKCAKHRLLLTATNKAKINYARKNK